jgi:hypothetical protein
VNLYRYVPVWSRTADGAVLYRCFEVFGQGFTVQSKDFFSPQRQGAQHMAQLGSQFLELFLEQAPDERFPVSPTIEAAIEAFNAYFSN